MVVCGLSIYRRGSRGGEMGEFSPPLYLSSLLSFFSYPSNIEIIFDDVNKIDRPNTTPTVRAICTFAVYFSVFQPFFFVASL